DVFAHGGADFDHRLMHLGSHALAEDALAVLDDAADVRLELARLRVDDLVLLLDSERELVVHQVEATLARSRRPPLAGRGAFAPPAAAPALATAPSRPRAAPSRPRAAPSGRKPAPSGRKPAPSGRKVAPFPRDAAPSGRDAAPFPRDAAALR